MELVFPWRWQFHCFWSCSQTCFRSVVFLWYYLNGTYSSFTFACGHWIIRLMSIVMFVCGHWSLTQIETACYSLTLACGHWIIRLVFEAKLEPCSSLTVACGHCSDVRRLIYLWRRLVVIEFKDRCRKLWKSFKYSNSNKAILRSLMITREE